jgi:hypothetical protein
MKKSIKKVAEGKSNYYLECFSFAKKYAKKWNIFSSEDIINAYEKVGKPLPKEPRVWGAVMKELHKINAISHYTFGKYKKPCGHSKPINIWISNIWNGL